MVTETGSVKITDEGIDIVTLAGIAALKESGTVDVAAVVVSVAAVVVADTEEEAGSPKVSGSFIRLPLIFLGVLSVAAALSDILF